MNARTTTLLVTGALLVVTVALRVPLLGATDLWLDEAATVIDAALPLREIPRKAHRAPAPGGTGVPPVTSLHARTGRMPVPPIARERDDGQR